MICVVGGHPGVKMVGGVLVLWPRRWRTLSPYVGEGREATR